MTIALVGPNHAPMKRYVLAEKMLSFHAIEPPYDVNSARGVMPRKFPGGLRPMLEWTHEAIDDTHDHAVEERS